MGKSRNAAGLSRERNAGAGSGCSPCFASQAIPDPLLESLGELDEAGLGWRERTRGVV